MSRRLSIAVLAGSVAVLVVLLARVLPLLDDADGSTGADGVRTPAGDSARPVLPGGPVLPGPVRKYAAIGDSFTAGPLVPYVARDPATCLRSSANYPQVLASWLGADRVADASCSGATTADLVGGPSAQVRTVRPGTDLVTIGIGGNDLDLFGELVRRCPSLAARDPAGAPCRASFTAPDGTDRLLSRVPGIADRVGRVVDAVRRRAPDAVVAVVGYPRLVPARGTCAALPFATGDYAWMDRVERTLNAGLARAAAPAGAVFVDTYTSSSGHDACAGPAAWVNGDRTRPTRALAYHPYARGMAGTAATAYATLTGTGPTAGQRRAAAALAERRPPGTLSLHDQRVLAALVSGG